MEKKGREKSRQRISVYYNGEKKEGLEGRGEEPVMEGKKGRYMS